jgi:probable HAF family extracellular repeat protein
MTATQRTREEMTMASTACTNLGRRLRLAAVAVALAALTVGVTGPAASTPVGAPAAESELTLLGARAPVDTTPRSARPAFLLTRGRYTRFDAPGAASLTGAGSINNRGVIVGLFRDAAGVDHGFRREPSGRFTTFDLPGATQTKPVRINDRGQITGAYIDAAGKRRGFLLDGDLNRLVRIDVPGAVSTQALGVNNRGQVVGDYQTPDGRFHGFRWERGRFVTIDKPGAGDTSLLDINDRGQLLGISAVNADPADPAGTRPFVLERGRYVTFAAPGDVVTGPVDLNNRGQIVGTTLAPTPADPEAGARGFLLARGARGPFTPIEVPGAPRTAAYGLNDAGAIVGVYENTNAPPAPQPSTPTPPLDTPGRLRAGG